MVNAAECLPTEVSDPVAAALLVPSDTGASGSECVHRRQVLSAAIAFIIAEMLWPADFTCEICEVPSCLPPGPVAFRYGAVLDGAVRCRPRSAGRACIAMYATIMMCAHLVVETTTMSFG